MVSQVLEPRSFCLIHPAAEALTLDPKEDFRSMFRLIPETGIPSAAKAAPLFYAFVSRVKPFAGTPGEYLG